MGNSEFISSESVSITADAYLQGLQMKYDFYGNLLGGLFLIGIFLFLIYIFTRS